MKDHEIIAQIGKLLDGADAPTRASVEAWLRARLSVAAPSSVITPDLARLLRELPPATVVPATMPPSILPNPPHGIPYQPKPPWEQAPWFPRGIEVWCDAHADHSGSGHGGGVAVIRCEPIGFFPPQGVA